MFGIRELVGGESIQEQRVPDHLPDDKSGDDQKIVSKEEDATGQISVAQVEEAFDPVRHERW